MCADAWRGDGTNRIEQVLEDNTEEGDSSQERG